MKAAVKFLSLLTLLISLNAFADEERHEANLDLSIQKEFVKVTLEETEFVTGIVPASTDNADDEIEIAGGVEATQGE